MEGVDRNSEPYDYEYLHPQYSEYANPKKNKRLLKQHDEKMTYLNNRMDELAKVMGYEGILNPEQVTPQKYTYIKLKAPKKTPKKTKARR